MYKFTVVLSFLLFAGCMAVQGQPLVVWPGDANNSGHVNHVDLLSIGLNFFDQGPARAVVNGTWTPDTLLTAWGAPSLAFADRGYADCNGDGRIDSADVAVHFANYSESWLPFTRDSSTLVLGTAPALSLDIVDSVFVLGTDTVFLDIDLGDGNQNLNNLYGLAFTVSFDPTIVKDVVVGDLGGWLNFDGESFVVQHVDTVVGAVEVGISRQDGLAVNGNGRIGSLGIVMDDDIRVSEDFLLPIRISFATANDAQGNYIYLRQVPDTLKVTTPFFAEPDPGCAAQDAFRVYPSWADETVTVALYARQPALLRVYDARGAQVFQCRLEGHRNHSIPVAQWSPGLYFFELTCHGQESAFHHKVVVGMH